MKKKHMEGCEDLSEIHDDSMQSAQAFESLANWSRIVFNLAQNPSIGIHVRQHVISSSKILFVFSRTTYYTTYFAYRHRRLKSVYCKFFSQHSYVVALK